MISSIARPALRTPPDDPTFWLLSDRIGWRPAADDLVQNVELGSVASLQIDPASGRQFDEPGGGFGGLAPPTNIAIAPDESLFLLNEGTGRLRRLDRCGCRFEDVPCGEYAAPDTMHPIRGIGIHGGDLFVCDTIRHQLLVYSLRGFVLRGIFSPPDEQPVANWLPTAVAFDRLGRVLVTDIANHAIHRFTRHGVYVDQHSVDHPTHLAVDGCDRIYVMTSVGLRVFDRNWNSQPVPEHVGVASDSFRPIPFQTDASGNINAGKLCVHGDGIFDRRGEPISIDRWNQPLVRFAASGTFIVEPLDSRIDQCVWHRLIIEGDVPKNTRATAFSYTSQVLLSANEIADIPADNWQALPDVVPDSLAGGHWDALFRNPPGRFLLLKLRLSGNGETTPTVRSVHIEYPRISLRRYLPAVFGEDPIGSEFTDRFLSNFDTTLRSIESHLDSQPHLFDPLTTPAHRIGNSPTDFLSWLASWIGVTLDRRLPEQRRRDLLKNASKLFGRRGTQDGMRERLLVWLGMTPQQATRCCRDPRHATTCSPLPLNCSPVDRDNPWVPPPLILEHYRLRRWLHVGHGRLGDQAVLWGMRIVNRSQLGTNAQVSATQINTVPDPLRDPFHVYAHRFSVFVPAGYRRDPAQKKALEQLIESEKPAHTLAQIEYVEPRFRIGVQSSIGFDSVVGRWPHESQLYSGDDSAVPNQLGCNTVIGESPHEQGGPSLQIGSNSRVGTTSLLN